MRIGNTPKESVVGGSYRMLRSVGFALLVLSGGGAFGQDLPGSLRVGVVDADWESPIPEASVMVAETDARVSTGADGQALVERLAAGTYTVVVSASGFERKVFGGVVVLAGQAQHVSAKLNAVYTDMDEFVVKDLDLAKAGSEIALLDLRAKSSTLMDSVGSDMMSKAGAGTAAAALRLVTGATVQDGKYAVIRGLGDRYTSTSLNGVRLPNADRDKRAVSMDQFPSAMIESVRVSKSFMPDQQGDATGGIDIRTKSIPDKPIAQISISTEYDTNATGNDDFKTYRNGGSDLYGMRGLTGLDFWNNSIGGSPRGGEDTVQKDDAGNITDVSANKEFSSSLRNEAPPVNYGFKYLVGDYVRLNRDWTFGGLVLGSYSQKYKYNLGNQHYVLKKPLVTDYMIEDGRDQRVENSVSDQLWSNGFVLGLKNEYNSIRFLTLLTHQTKDSVQLRTDVADSETTVVENRTPATPPRPGRPGQPEKLNSRTTTEVYTSGYEDVLSYVENQNATVQLAGDHKFSYLDDSVLDWNLSYNMAESIEPDRRKNVVTYRHESTTVEKNNTPTNLTNPDWETESETETDNVSFNAGGTGERRWQDTREDDFQLQSNYKQPYTVRDGWEGWVKGGYFGDLVKRKYRNRIYAPAGVTGTSEDLFDPDIAEDYDGNSLGGLLDGSIGYDGKQEIMAGYFMGRLPLPEWIDLTGGLRMESTMLETAVSRAAASDGAATGDSIKIYEIIDDRFIANALRVNPNVDVAALDQRRGLLGQSTRPIDEANSKIDQIDALPAAAVTLKPVEEFSVRFSYSKTIARPIFKEITPIVYSDFDSSRVFLGNPSLNMAQLDNYDLRFEFRPDKNSVDLVSFSVFYKTVTDPIQYSTRKEADSLAVLDYIYPENYKDAAIKGLEFEVRKSLDIVADALKDFSVGGNITVQESEVGYTDDLLAQLRKYDIYKTVRPMDGQSDLLANVNLIYNNEDLGFSTGLFYNWRGETYVSGDTATADAYVPAIVERPVDTLDFTIGYKFKVGESRFSPTWRIAFEIKNILDPVVETIYRTPYADLPRTDYKTGRLYGVSLGCEW